MSRPLLLALVAHPDDESLIAGGTLARAARAGTDTAVVSLTRGELGPIADPSLASQETLGDVREEELRQATILLGVPWARCLELPDGELPWIEQPAALEALVAALGGRVPTAILTFGEDGLYGHPDHTAAAALAHGLALRLGGAEVYEAAWNPATLAALASAAASHGLAADLWGLEPEDFGSERKATISVDIRTVLPLKLAALRAHRTQLGPEHLFSQVPLDLAERYLGTEPWAGPPEGRLQDLLGDG
jgi:LmbE family N-acetylglucosaminyl deacetylase